MKIVAGNFASVPDAALIRALRNAHRWSETLKSGKPLNRLATEVNVSERYLARTIALAGLSPRIQAAIVDGNQPDGLTLKRLLRIHLPLEWKEQDRALGFGV